MKNFIQKILLCIAVCITAITMGLSQTGVPITINPSPTLYSVMGGGIYCAGQPGVTVSLSGSESLNTNYQLLCNGTNLGLPTSGTGNPLDFGTQINSGTYTVIATNTLTGCSITMSNSVNVQINAIPNVTITASGPVTFCGTGNTVTLTGDGGVGCTYQWQLNNSNIAGANLPSYVANQTGSFKVVATNGNGCSNSHDTMVIMNPLPQAFAVTSNASNFCEGGSGVTITLSASQTGVNYQLMLDGSPSGAPVLGGSVLNWFNQAVAGVYTVEATDNTTNCTATMTGSVIVTMDPLPATAGTITGTTTVCQNSTIAFSTNTIVNTTNYIWSVPTGAMITSGQGTTQIQVDFSGASSGNIGVFGQNTCGAGQPSLLAVTVNQAPSLTVAATYTDICNGVSTNLTANGGGTMFSWSGGYSTQTITVSPATTTTYYVTVTGSNSCTSTDNIAITVHALPNVTLALAQDNFCTDVNSAIISGGSPAGGTYTGTCVFGGNTVYPPVSGAGTYTVTYSYTDAYGCSASATDLLTINPIPAISFTNIPGPIYTDTPPFDLTAFGSPTGGTFSGSGMLGSMFDPKTAGAGTHMLTYTYVHPTTGCSASQIQYITVGAVGIDEVSAAVNAVNIFPNPTANKLNLTGINTKEIKSISIMNGSGDVVFATKTVTEKMQLNVSDYAPGTYVIDFMNAAGNSRGKKFVKNQ